MPEAHQIVLTTAAIVAANEAVLSPLAGHGTPWADFNWRLLPATVVATGLFYGLEKVASGLAKGLAVMMLVTVMFVPLSGNPPPLVNLSDMLDKNAKSNAKGKG